MENLTEALSCNFMYIGALYSLSVAHKLEGWSKTSFLPFLTVQAAFLTFSIPVLYLIGSILIVIPLLLNSKLALFKKSYSSLWLLQKSCIFALSN